MKIRSILAAVFVMCIVAALTAPSGFAQGKGKQKSGPQVVGTDPDNDWGTNVDPTIAPAGDLLGQELVEAAMEMADKDTVNFIIKLKSLPAPGGVPEFTRYGWDFSVDGDAMLISGAFTELIRGVCYPLHSDPACPPNFGDPAAAMDAPFFVRQGTCTVGAGGVADCTVRAIVSAAFDPAAGTITVPVPLEAIGAKPGSKIAPLPNASFSATIYATSAAVVASPNAPHDAMLVTETFVVPSGKKAKKR
jgi:hypothetical protein